MSDEDGSRDINEGVLRVTRMVRAKMRANGGDRVKALAAVAVEIAPERPAAARDLWEDGFGYFAVAEAEKYVLRHRPSALMEIPEPATNGKPDLPDNWGTSRWDDVDPLSIEQAIGATGERKPFGDFTAEDLRVSGEWRRGIGSTMVRHGTIMLGLAEKVPEDGTLRDTLPVMDDTERRAIEEITKATFSEAATV